MKKVVIIPTEKESISDMFVLEKVLKSISPQVDDILLIKNHREEKKWGLAYSRVLPSNAIQLFSKKTDNYMIATVMKSAFDYIKDTYTEPIFLMTLGDDCIPNLSYVKSLTKDLTEKVIYAPSQSWLEYDTQLVDYIHYAHEAEIISRHVGHVEDITSYEYVMERFNELGKTFLINGVSGYIWDPQCEIRPDEKYNGHWGYEDTDFKMQMLKAGYIVKHRPDARFWHIQTEHKKENRQPTAHDTPNRKYFKEKWNPDTTLK
jgi:hypothetical protein